MTHVQTPQSMCLFGVASCDITPPVGIYHRMWGAATHDRATGVHRPLIASVLCFKALDRHDPLEAERVLVALDHCLLWGQEMAALLAKLSSASGLAKEQLAITFSHTHGAGLLGGERASLPGGDQIGPYLESMGDELAELVQTTRRQMEPATITYGSGHCDLAAQRDFWDEDSQQFVCGFNPQGMGDDTVVVARVTAAHGRLLATVVNYACHPTTLAWQNTLISPDYPGALRELVEQTTGAPCIFLQGASGDLGPREGFVGDATVADRNGRQLGFAALSVLESLPPPGTRFVYTGPVVSGATLGSWAHQPLPPEELARSRRWQVRRWTVDLPYRPDLPNREQTEKDRQHWLSQEQEALKRGETSRARDCRAMVERMTRQLKRLDGLPPGEHLPFAINLWRQGGAFWVLVSGELYHLFQRELRQRFPGVPIIVATLTNGWLPGYLPTADTYGKGIYQESIAIAAPGSLEKLLRSVSQQIQEML